VLSLSLLLLSPDWDAGEAGGLDVGFC